MSNTKSISVIGIGHDGCVSLTSRAVNAVARAQILVGGERQLAFFPQFDGQRILLKKGLMKTIREVEELSQENTVAVLASGDPLFYGIGGLLCKKLGAKNINFIPQPSSIQWAFARVGLPWQDAKLVSLHGKPLQGLANRIRHHGKVGLLTDPTNTPQAIAKHLLAFTSGQFTAHVCENLAGPDESIKSLSLEQLMDQPPFSDLNVLLLVRNEGWTPPSVFDVRSEDEFAKRMPKKGLITKREIRALTLSAMNLRRDSTVWDIGAGSGSVSIEASYLANNGRVFAIEVDEVGVEICRENCRRFGADNVEVIHGRAPAPLAELPNPDAVFVGGSKGAMEEIITLCFERMNPGGTLVVNAITLDNVHKAYQTFKSMSLRPQISLVQISRGQKLANYMRYDALNPIHIFSVQKPKEQL